MAVPLQVGGLRAVHDLIERYDLHRFAQVPIQRVARWEGWHIQYQSGMAPAYGLAVVHGGVRLMVINEDVTDAIQRATMAHEIAHVLLGHTLGLDLYGPRNQMASLLLEQIEVRQEREADMAAAVIMIPEHLLFECETVDEIMCRCHVPRRLAEVRWQGFERGYA